MINLTYGSVCSGIEAATAAWHVLGWRLAWFAEIEDFPSRVLAQHYPNVPNLGDMTQIAAAVRAGAVPAPDVLVGGTPCQAFSVAGLRESLDDARGQLTLAYVELADAIDDTCAAAGEPECIIVWENVPGVLNTKDNAFGCFLGALAGEDCALEPPRGKWANAGCVSGPKRTIAWRVLDAQYFGVAQRRRRVFVVASAREGFDPTEVLFEFDGVRRDSAPSREPGQDAAAGTLRSTDGGSDIDHARAGHLQPVTATLDASYGRLQGCAGQDMNHGHSHLVPLAFGGNNQSGPIDVATARNACSSGSGRLDFETETFLVQCITGDITHTLKAEGFDASEDGTGLAQPIVAAFAENTRAEVRYEGGDGSRTGTLSTGGGKPGQGTPTVQVGMAVRRLTPRECERLQGFPDDYTLVPVRGKPAADGPRYKALGNSMAVPCMRWIGQRIAQHLSNPYGDLL